MSDVAERGTTGGGAYDVVVIGAGFTGMYMLYRLRRMGLSVRVFEAAGDVGGTWYWNRYPGARCDIESVDYSYSFDEDLQQEWVWSERYPAQPEILAYLNHVADRFDLRRDIQFDTRVTAAHFQDGTNRWLVRTDDGQEFSAQFCVAAVGALSKLNEPNYPGMETFRGERYHPARWPHEGVDFTGRRVGIVGTGSTGTQIIPVVARQAEHLTVFQRTPNFSVPAGNRPLDEAYLQQVKQGYAQRRERNRASMIGVDLPWGPGPAMSLSDEERRREYERRWGQGGFNFLVSFPDLLTDEAANRTAAEFIRERIHEVVADPQVAAMLTPDEYPFGAKRVCVDSGYYETFNRPNVTLVDLRKTPIEEITPDGVRTTDAEHRCDALIFATGFDALTGALLAMDIRGAGGQELRARWAYGPRTYLGMAASGLPNMFMVAGPGSPAPLTNAIVSIEQNVEWITDCIDHLRRNGYTRIEVSPAAEKAWTDHVNEVARNTLYTRARSWYTGANIPGKPRTFMPYAGGVAYYRQQCDAVAARNYRGFVLTRD